MAVVVVGSAPERGRPLGETCSLSPKTTTATTTGTTPATTTAPDLGGPKVKLSIVGEGGGTPAVVVVVVVAPVWGSWARSEMNYVGLRARTPANRRRRPGRRPSPCPFRWGRQDGSSSRSVPARPVYLSSVNWPQWPAGRHYRQVASATSWPALVYDSSYYNTGLCCPVRLAGRATTGRKWAQFGRRGGSLSLLGQITSPVEPTTSPPLALKHDNH